MLYIFISNKIILFLTEAIFLLTLFSKYLCLYEYDRVLLNPNVKNNFKNLYGLTLPWNINEGKFWQTTKANKAFCFIATYYCLSLPIQK